MLADLSIAVMGDTRRAVWLRATVATIRAQHDRVDVIVDQGQYRTVWKTARVAWQAAERHDADWHLVVTEDTLFCHDFVRHAREALAAVPEEACVSFIKFGTPPPPEVTWLVSSTVTGGNALALPRNLRRAFMDWEAANVHPEYKHDDARIALYLLHSGFRSWYTNPCLVDHLGADLHSLTGQHPPISRRAMRFAGIFPFTVDWVGGATRPLWSAGHSLPAYGAGWRAEMKHD